MYPILESNFSYEGLTYRTMKGSSSKWKKMHTLRTEPLIREQVRSGRIKMDSGLQPQEKN